MLAGPEGKMCLTVANAGVILPTMPCQIPSEVKVLWEGKIVDLRIVLFKNCSKPKRSENTSWNCFYALILKYMC